MIDEMEQMIKEKLLEGLIDKMSGGMADRMKPKDLGVEVQAPDKEHLAEGLDKAKDILGKDVASDDGGDEDDEQRMLELLDHDDDEKET